MDLAEVGGRLDDAEGISVIIPTYKRLDELRRCLGSIASCIPGPRRVYIAVDHGGGIQDVMDLASEFKLEVECFHAEERMGPGGLRSLLYRRAKGRWLVSLDDDSQIVDEDFFGRIAKMIDLLPADCAVVDIPYSERGESFVGLGESLYRSYHFSGGSCILRKELIEALPENLRVPSAYGIEEVITALDLCNMDLKVYKTNMVRTFHDDDGLRRASRANRISEMRNGFVLPFMRFPWPMVPLGVAKAFVSGLKISGPRGSYFTDALTGAWDFMDMAMKLRVPVRCKVALDFLLGGRIGRLFR